MSLYPNMDITVNQLFGDQSDSNDATSESPTWLGSANQLSIKRAISDHYIHDKLSFDSGIICSANTTNAECNGIRVSSRGVPQSLTKFFDEDDEDVLALGGQEITSTSDAQCANELSCHNRELDWVVYVESFAERYYMEQNGVIERVPVTSYEDEIERIARKRTETKTLSGNSRQKSFGLALPDSKSSAKSWAARRADLNFAKQDTDSPLYFGNSSVVLVKENSLYPPDPKLESPFSPDDEDKFNSSGSSSKNLTSWNRKFNSNNTPRSGKNPNRGLPFHEFTRSSPTEREIRDRKRNLRLSGLVGTKNAKCHRVAMRSQILARKRSMSCSSVSPSPSILSTENEFPERGICDQFGQQGLEASSQSPGTREYTETQCMVKAVVDTCAEIRSVYSKHLKYTNATDKGFTELNCKTKKSSFLAGTSSGIGGGVGGDWRRKRDEMQSRELSHLVLSGLCPQLLQLVASGLSPKYTPWEVVRLGAVPVPGVTCIHELCLSVSVMSELESTEEKFNSFVFGLLNQKIMETWLLLLLKNSSLISGCYDSHNRRPSSSFSSTSSSFNSSSLQSQSQQGVVNNSNSWLISSPGLPTLLSNKVLFTELLLAVQPLAFICFYTDLRFEIDYHVKHSLTHQAPTNNLDLTPVSSTQSNSNHNHRNVFTNQPMGNKTPVFGNENYDSSARVSSTYWALPSGGFHREASSISCKERGGSCGDGNSRTRLAADDISGDLPHVGGNYRCWDLVEASLGSLIRRVGCENKNLSPEESEDPVTYV
ncbi:uncharacterized protein LOC134854544 isoform X2 [Symsagittifera roscoffensis]|uniref:uncharacterized protein LOC134854544 isoform X2 n=1 Tax=Symsagittifera roscoffensis TaxID=84072 RepID=UPI00307C9234